MKTNKLILLFLFVLNSAFSQEKIDSSSTKASYSKWSIQIASGISDGTRPYSNGYYSRINNKLFNNFRFNTYTAGATYNFSKAIGIKMDLTFDKFTNNNKDVRSKPYEVVQYRTSLQCVFNLNNFIKPRDKPYAFNILFHTGFNFARLKPIRSDVNPIVSDGDNYGGIVLGLAPKLRMSKKTALYLDFSSISNYGQNLTWNGKHSATTDNTNGHLLVWNFGLSIDLGKPKMETPNPTSEDVKNKLAALQNKINDLETKMLDTDGDGVVDALDEEKDTPKGNLVDNKGRTKVLSNTETEVIANSNSDKTKTENENKNVSPTTLESISADGGEVAKKLINDGYIVVYFNLGDDKPADNSREGLGFILTYLRNNPNASVDILGKTDETGTEDLNNKLGAARAKNVKNILIKAGINSSRMKIVSKGEDKSVDAKSSDARSLVRKVIFVINN